MFLLNSNTRIFVERLKISATKYFPRVVINAKAFAYQVVNDALKI